MYRHFCLRHPAAELKIIEDGKLKRCEFCNMFAKDMDRHVRTATCRKGRTRRINENKQLLQHNANNVKFYINGKELERVTNFKYLGRIFTENDCNLLCIQS